MISKSLDQIVTRVDTSALQLSVPLDGGQESIDTWAQMDVHDGYHKKNASDPIQCVWVPA